MSSANWQRWCSQIQDQGQCGSCTGFGSIGIWEPSIRIKENNPNDPIKLSERDLFFCSGGTCENGNTVEAVLEWAQGNGTCLEECLPYGTTSSGTDSPCGQGICANPTYATLASWTSITDVAQMKLLLQSGPLVTTMECHQSFMHYQSGVYHNLGASDPIVGGHCVGIVGYDDTKQAWLLRNSWGTGWGMGGYCWIAYGDSQIDSMMYQLVPGTTPLPPPPAPPTPVTISVTASDPNDKKVRYWEMWVDVMPGPYLGGGKYTNLAQSSNTESSGNTVVWTVPLSSGSHILYFGVTQSGGSKYGTYSGTVTINGVVTPFNGVNVNLTAEIPFTV